MSPDTHPALKLVTGAGGDGDNKSFRFVQSFFGRKAPWTVLEVQVKPLTCTR